MQQDYNSNLLRVHFPAQVQEVAWYRYGTRYSPICKAYF